MGLLDKLKGLWNRMFKDEVTRAYNVRGLETPDMVDAISKWMEIYAGRPAWESQGDGVHTINFAKYLCSEVARLTCLDIDVAFDGSRKEAMQDFWSKSVLPRFQHWVEYGAAVGSFILKPNGDGVDFMTPDRFEITQVDSNGRITGAVFQDSYSEWGKYYTKLEYHSFWTAKVKMPDSDEYVQTTYYRIQNKAYKSSTQGAIGSEVSLTDTKWNNLQPEVYIARANEDALGGMLFGYFKMPLANNIDINSPLGVSVFANAVKELEDLDVAYSRNTEEIYNSGKIVLLDDRLTDTISRKNGSAVRHKIPMPSFVKNVTSDNPDEFYQEIVPTLQTATRNEGINALLSLIGCKCGFSNGYFVLDQKTGMVTATQIEADDRGTIQSIKAIRDALKTCLDELFYAQSVFWDLYETVPTGDYEANYAWGDLTYSYEEDKQTWWKYVAANKMPAWMYFVKFEGMTEEEAKSFTAEATPAGLFDEE